MPNKHISEEAVMLARNSWRAIGIDYEAGMPLHEIAAKYEVGKADVAHILSPFYEVADRGYERDIDICDRIKTFIINVGYPPTIREICEIGGIRSTSHAANILNRLHLHNLLTVVRDKRGVVRNIVPR